MWYSEHRLNPQPWHRRIRFGRALENLGLRLAACGAPTTARFGGFEDADDPPLDDLCVECQGVGAMPLEDGVATGGA